MRRLPPPTRALTPHRRLVHKVAGLENLTILTPDDITSDLVRAGRQAGRQAGVYRREPVDARVAGRLLLLSGVPVARGRVRHPTTLPPPTPPADAGGCVAVH